LTESCSGNYCALWICAEWFLLHIMPRDDLSVFSADLIRALQKEFPHTSIQHSNHLPGGLSAGGPASPSSVGVEGLFYEDDLCLCSTDPLELQTMTNFVQRWSERSRLQIDAEKTKIMAFHEINRQASDSEK
jgi:hypothetical protein